MSLGNLHRQRLSDATIVEVARHGSGHRSKNASHHGIKCDVLPHRPAKSEQKDEVAREGKDPEGDRKRDQHGMNGMSSNACVTFHTSPQPFSSSLCTLSAQCAVTRAFNSSAFMAA